MVLLIRASNLMFGFLLQPIVYNIERCLVWFYIITNHRKNENIQRIIKNKIEFNKSSFSRICITYIRTHNYIYSFSNIINYKTKINRNRILRVYYDYTLNNQA